MPDLALLEALHFLRPWWLVAIVPAIALWLFIRRRTDASQRMRRVIAPHLLSHLTVGGDTRARLQPVHLVSGFIVLGAIGTAGPTCEREIPPFTEDTAPLVVAIDLSRTMNATDVQPSRLSRAKIKFRDIMDLRRGSPTGLIVYAGTAHTVLPLCDDPDVFEPFLDALQTDIMPMPGKDASRALALAETLLADEPTPGSILFLTDGIAESHAEAFASHADRTQDAVLVLAIGTPEGGPVREPDGRFATDTDGRRLVASLDLAGLNALSGAAGVFTTRTSPDDDDVRRIERRIQSHLRRAQSEDPDARWRDAGPALALPMLILGLLWFRRGWTVRWSAAILVFATLTGCGSAPREKAGFIDLWLTPDQQGRMAFDDLEFAAAAEAFEDPLWKGVAFYRTGDMEAAIDWFARSRSPEADFNMGNAYAVLHRYAEAVASYDAALADRPEWVEARENRECVKGLMDAQSDEPPERAEGGEPSFNPDEEEASGLELPVPDPGTMEEEPPPTAELWLRRLQTTPADFLRKRFAIEMAAQLESTRENKR
jgi:Ca-activated chloride channel family protein